MFTWGRLAGLAGVAVAAAAGAVYLTKNEKGRQLLDQTRTKCSELWAKAKEVTGRDDGAGLPEFTAAALAPGQPVAEEQPA